MGLVSYQSHGATTIKVAQTCCMGIFLVHVNVAIAAMHGWCHRQAERSLIAFSPEVVRGNFGGACKARLRDGVNIPPRNG